MFSKLFSVAKHLSFIFVLIFSCGAYAIDNYALPNAIKVELKQLSIGNSNSSVTVVATNQSGTEITFQKSRSILAEIQQYDYFDVIRISDGLRMQFMPIHARLLSSGNLLKPITLSAGESLEVSINIEAYYGANDGEQYRVGLKGINDVKKTVVVSTNKALWESNAISSRRNFSHRSCTVNQRNQINTALQSAEIISNVAASDLASTPVPQRPNAKRYEEWFGEYSASRYDRVLNSFRSIADAATNQSVSFDCGCSAIPNNFLNQVFAYVNPGVEYVVNLCGAFWQVPSLPTEGRESQAGTIVHELSHFSVLGGQNVLNSYPEVYGRTQAMFIADTNPTHAVNNAENYNYFAENVPYLSMSQNDLDVSSCQVDVVGGSTAIQAEPYASEPLSNAVDNGRVEFSGDFFRTTVTSTSGGDSAASRDIGNDGVSLMFAEVTGPGSVTFDWRVSSELNYDGLIFELFKGSDLSGNGLVVNSDFITGEVGWGARNFTIPGGNHTLIWAYVKDETISGGSDRGWVDNVRITGPSGASFSSAGFGNTEVVNCQVLKGRVNIAPIIYLLLEEEI